MAHLSHRSRFVFFASTMILLCSSLTHAQDPMAKWKPNVGDKFTYDVRHSWNNISGKPDTGSSRDTIVMEIVRTDTAYDSIHTSVVAVEGDAQRYFDFHSAGDTASAHAVAFITLPFDYSRTDAYAANFTSSHDSQFVIGSKSVTGYQEIVQRGYQMAALLQQKVIYSPDIRWFLYFENTVDGNAYANVILHEFTSETLIMASSLGVSSSLASAGDDFTVGASGSLLYLTLLKSEAINSSLVLLDPLGRPVRSWQLAASDSPREITLNVADVPSGVYFLRLHGDEVDEVRKVAIVH